MKKLNFFAPAILLAATIALVMGCSNVSGASVGKTGSANSAGKHHLTATVSNFSEHFVRDDVSARSINPTAWKLSEKGTSINFYLYGEATNGEKYNTTFAEIPAAKIDAQGNFDLDLDAYNWTLWLFACKSKPSSYSDALTKAALVARAHVDLTTSAMGAVFKLTSIGLTGNGFYDFNVKLDGWKMSQKDTAMTATIGIYNRITGAKVTAIENIADSALSDTAAKPMTDTTTGIKAGVYSLQVRFYNPTTGKTYVYGDTLNIVPQKTSVISETAADNVLLVPDIIGTKPAAPSDAYAIYDASSLGAAQFPEYYTAAIVWKDNSTNERYFDLRLQEVTGNTTEPTTWDDVNCVFGENIIEQTTLYAGGSLLSGNTVVLVRLPLGKKYAAQIRATNDAGSSDWVPVAIAESSNVATGSVTGITSGKEGYFKSWDKTTKGDTINLLRMVYHIQGGSYVSDDNAGDIVWTDAENNIVAKTDTWNAIKTIAATKTAGKYDTTTDKTVYFSKVSTDNVGTDVWAFAENALQCNGFPVTSWSRDTTDGTKLVPGTDKYNEFANVDLYANYTPQGTIQIVEDKSILEPKATWLTIYGPGTGDTLLLGDGAKTASVTDGGDHEITFEVTVPDSLDDKLGDDKKFDSIQILVKKTGTTRIVYSAKMLSAALSAGGTPTEFTKWKNVTDGLYTITVTFMEGSEIRSLPDIVLTVNQVTAGGGGGGGATPSVTSVTITGGDRTINKGASETLSATVTATGGAATTVTWSVVAGGSSDITVDPSTGEVTVSAGATTGDTADIKATSTADSSKSATITVTVGS